MFKIVEDQGQEVGRGHAAEGHTAGHDTEGHTAEKGQTCGDVNIKVNEPSHGSPH